jgi:glycine hydroxymethyltransferase
MDKIFSVIAQEKKRQKEELEMIPSENFASAAVMKAVGSCLMNKYAEGYPKRRYYQGNVNVDQIEDLCRERVLKAFNLDPEKWGVNVQPHSGCEANLAVYNALLQAGDKLMSMYLPDGGHLSHGWHMPGRKITFVSKVFKVEFYHVDKKTLVFDYDQIEKQALKYRPQMIISGGTAYPREINYKRLAQIAHKVGALYLADVAHEAGLIAAGAMKSPFPYVDVATFTTHKTFRGPRGAIIVARKSLIDKVNFSIIPGLQGGPHMHSIAGIAVAAKELMTPAFKKYAVQVVKNAKTLAAELKKGGLDIVSGGTDKHLVLVDLRNVGLTGWVVAWALEKASIIANRNTVPYDTGSPFYPSGLRLGTPALTTRGMKEKEMVKISGWILAVINYLKDKNLPNKQATLDKLDQDKFLQRLKAQVKAFASKYPVPGL